MDTRIVQFFSRSATKDDLGINFGNWRNYLSNFQEPSGRTLIIPDPIINKDTADSDIIYRHYYTVEHYFQACKYLLATENPEFFLNFNMHGNIDRNPIIAKRTGSKTYMKKYGFSLNTALWNSYKDLVMETALRSRFNTDPLFKKILIKTLDNNLYLLHFERSSSKSYWGGAVNKTSGCVKGFNKLGQILMDIRIGS